MVYAKEGHKFYSVVTPGVAVEYELPANGDFSTRQQRKWDELEDAAETAGAPIIPSNYALLR
jgi:hypothetical protein